MINLQVDFDEYVRCDENEPCHGQLTDQEIIEEHLTQLPSDSSDEEDLLESPTCSEVLNSISVLRRFFVNDSKYSNELENMEKDAVNTIEKHTLQSKITDFFNQN